MSNREETNQSSSRSRPRVVFFCMRCHFSLPSLRALISSEVELLAVFVAGRRGAPFLEASREPKGVVLQLVATPIPDSIDGVARDAGVPVYSVGSLKDENFIRLLQILDPDVIAVSCFPWLIPEKVRAIPRFGCLNLHPSLLPRWRGPEPLLWTFLAGDRETGVTIHLMDRGFDTGPILSQLVIPVPDGVDGVVLETELAKTGARLLAETIGLHVIGTTNPIPQIESLATNAPVPHDHHLVFSNTSPAHFLFNVIRGATPLWGEIRIRIDSTEEEVTVKQALDFNADDVMPTAIERVGEIAVIRCNPGVLTVVAR